MSGAAAMPIPTRDELIERIGRLPALPSVAVDLLAGLEDPDADIGALARRVATDQAITARMLRVANSSFYGLQGRVNSVHEAMVVLGFRTVRSLVITTAAFSTLSALSPAKAFRPLSFWRHSVGAAVACRQLATLARRDPDAAFTAGLLHDVGFLVLAACFPDFFVSHWGKEAQPNAWLEAEPQPATLIHGEAGGLLAAHWALPKSLVDAIALHHRVDAVAGNPLIDLTHAADVVSHALQLAGDADELTPPLADSAWARLGIGWSDLKKALARIEVEFDETIQALLPNTGHAT